ncbi:MAG: WecB/TagA/CpsF family glycosyltransferase, partial [Clostridia bacterium]|nr:WecB/TagA/CpsF family glycosyltransferase [Clostridia bacterium]
MRIYNVRIDAVTAQEAVERLIEGEARGRTVFTPNAVMLDACRRDGRLAKMLNRSSLSVADGSGVLLAARRQGEPLPCRVAGIELGERMMREAAERGLRVFLLGGREGVAEAARDRLCGEIENLLICGTYHGYFDKTGKENEHVCKLIRASA